MIKKILYGLVLVIFELNLFPKIVTAQTADSFRYPLDGSWTVIQDFGVWNSTWGGYHLAEDALASIGTAVYASANGIVKFAQTGVSGYGGLVIIEHILSDASKICTLYGHLSGNYGIQVSLGQEVSKGQLIGYIADPSEYGYSGPSHIHFGIRLGQYTTQQFCGHWAYVGYSQSCSGITHEQYLAMWTDPSDFIARFNTSQVQAAISSYVPNDPNNPVEVQVGNSVPISVTFTNTGNTDWSFIAGASVWDSNGNIVGDYSKTVYLGAGQQTTVSWSHTVNSEGDYWLQFGIWKDSRTLLDKKPSPAQLLIKGVQAQTISASINSYVPNDPNNPVEVQVGNSTSISVAFTNTGNTAWSFIAGASVWDSNGNIVGDYSRTVYLGTGQQTTVSWSHTVNSEGDYWLQFGIWKDSQALLDKKPSPSQRLIKGITSQVTISGYVHDSSNNGISGVTLSFSNGGGSTTTNSSGYYSASVSYGWSGTVTPSKSGWTFSPSSRTYSNVTSNQSNQNYTGTQIQETVSTPNIPTGPSSGKVGQNLTFSTGGSTSNLGHSVEYQFDWGDGTQSGWGSSTHSHSYSGSGTKYVKARARCQTHTSIVSGWSGTKSVSISYCTLNISVSPSGSGAVSKSPDKTGYNYNENVQLTANAGSGYKFDHWGGNLSGSDNPKNITMNGSKNVTAYFSLKTGSLIVTINPSDVRSSARWRLTSGPDTNWKQSGQTIYNIPVGDYTLQFNEVDGWTKPVDKSVEINEGSNTLEGTYSKNDAVKDNNNSIPTDFVLYQNYPNPFNAETIIQYQIPRRSWVAIKVFNLAGEEIRTLVNEENQPGDFTVAWNAKDSFGKDVPSGIYIYVIRAGDFMKTMKMLLIR